MERVNRQIQTLMQQVAREVVLKAPVASPLVALAVVVVVMTAPATMVDVPRGLLLVEVRHKMAMAQFLELEPLIFVGDGKPTTAEQWLRDMKRIFCFMNCTEKKKVRMVEFQLQCNAKM